MMLAFCFSWPGQQHQFKKLQLRESCLQRCLGMWSSELPGITSATQTGAPTSRLGLVVDPNIR